MKAFAALSLALVVLLAFPGCRTRVDKDRERDVRRVALEPEMKARIPPDSPLAAVGFGMTEAEVGTLLGAPDAKESFAGNKPYALTGFPEKESLRTLCYYKGVGRVGFSSGRWGQRNGVVVIESDPDEPGSLHRR